MKSITMTEDRQIFVEELASIGEPVAPSRAAYSVEEVGTTHPAAQDHCLLIHTRTIAVKPRVVCAKKNAC